MTGTHLRRHGGVLGLEIGNVLVVQLVQVSDQFRPEILVICTMLELSYALLCLCARCRNAERYRALLALAGGRMPEYGSRKMGEGRATKKGRRTLEQLWLGITCATSSHVYTA